MPHCQEFCVFFIKRVDAKLFSFVVLRELSAGPLFLAVNSIRTGGCGGMKYRQYQSDLTEEEKLKPYAKHFYKPLARVPDNILSAIEAGPMDPGDVLPLSRINELLDPGYHAVETGSCFMPDGTCYVAVLTDMPGVTGEMIDWWLWWHSLEDLRYKIWYPGSHLGISVADREKIQNASLSARERYWNNPQFPVEDVGIGPDVLAIYFMPPEDFGFDASRFDSAKVATVVCTEVSSVTKKVRHTRMCHYVRKTSRGVEMRSRFWVGVNIKVDMFPEGSIVNRMANAKFMRRLTIPRGTPLEMARHCAREYANLAEILPDLYRDYGP
jgi:phloretin hydrolase